MSDGYEAEWLDITQIGSAYEEQIDVRARDEALWKYRHRRTSVVDGRRVAAEWQRGSAPGGIGVG